MLPTLPSSLPTGSLLPDPPSLSLSSDALPLSRSPAHLPACLHCTAHTASSRHPSRCVPCSSIPLIPKSCGQKVDEEKARCMLYAVCCMLMLNAPLPNALFWKKEAKNNVVNVVDVAQCSNWAPVSCSRHAFGFQGIVIFLDSFHFHRPNVCCEKWKKREGDSKSAFGMPSWFPFPGFPLFRLHLSAPRGRRSAGGRRMGGCSSSWSYVWEAYGRLLRRGWIIGCGRKSARPAGSAMLLTYPRAWRCSMCEDASFVDT